LEGLSAYAKVQSDLQCALAHHFRIIWQQPLLNAESLLAQSSMSDGNYDPAPQTQPMDLSNEQEVEEADDNDDNDEDGVEEGDLEADLDEEGYESDTKGVRFYC